MATNSTPTTANHKNYSGITQFGPQRHITWNHEGLPKDPPSPPPELNLGLLLATFEVVIIKLNVIIRRIDAE